MLSRIAAIAVAATFAAATPALACKGNNLQLSDDFQELDQGWNPVMDFMDFSAAGGHATVSSPAGKFSLITYEGAVFPTGDVCVDVSFPDLSPSTQNQVSAGLAFLTTWSNTTDFYTFTISAGGTASVSRNQNGAWLSPVRARKFDAVKIGGTNTLRLTLKGATASAYVNDKLFASFKVTPNPGGKLGLYAEAQGNQLQFGNFKVTDVPQ